MALVASATGLQIHEALLSSTENGYNPIASPDGKYIAYVRTGRAPGSGGFGRSNLRSDIAFMDTQGNALSSQPPAHCFLQGWVQDSDDVVCYRDWNYYLVSPPGNVARSGVVDLHPEHTEMGMGQSERVAYLSKREEFIWVHRIDGVTSEIVGSKGVIDGSTVNAGLSDVIIVPSADERYIAAFCDYSGLWTFDTLNKTWVDFGKITVHPSSGWDWMKPSWNPWFPNEDRIAFVQNSKLIVATADGNKKTVVLEGLKNAGLAVPSPDGTRVAFATFDPTPMKFRGDLQFFGGTTLWVAEVREKSKAVGVTEKNRQTTLTLHWLGNSKLLFERVPHDIAFTAPHRIWTADLPQ